MNHINIKSIFLALGLVVFAAGCADLEEVPEGRLTPDSFYSTESDIKAGVVATYRPFMEFYLNAQGGVPAMGGDDVTTRTGGNKEPYRGFDRFTADPSYGWLKQHSWDPLFRTIFHANAVINNYTNVPESFSRDAAASEAFFLRAWAYFRLVRTFGPVPIVTGTASGEEPRSPESEVYDLIISDLTFAEERLPSRWFGEPGRVTKWAAKSLLAKVYLTSAGWPLKRTENYALAAAKAQEVIDGSSHRLLSDFADVFDPNNENNRESVLAIQACQECGDWGLSNRMGYSIAAEAEESGWDDYYAEISFFEEFPEGPRKDATFQTSFSGNVPWQET
ncbi:MAG: RagB/SusD family nutrient uptake outer membrane protein, partial [Bacteroidota bacterium]